MQALASTREGGHGRDRKPFCDEQGARPKPGNPPPPPKWMQGIDQFTPAKAFGLGALLGSPNPKNLLLSIAAGKKAEENINELKTWLGANNVTVMVVLFVIFGISLISDGLQGLFA